MKNALLLFVCIFLFTGSLFAQKLTADAEKSKITWLGEKVTGMHTGTVNLKSGWLTFENNQITSGEFLIDMTSIKDSESNQKLEGHLKSDDFFGIEKFPESKLTLTGSTTFDKGSAVVKGTLTVKGTSSPVEFKTAMQKSDEGTRFFSNIVLDRTKYNVRYGSGTFFDNLGDKTIFDEFTMKVNLLVK